MTSIFWTLGVFQYPADDFLLKKKRLKNAFTPVILKPGHSHRAHFKALRILLKKSGTTFFDRRNGFPINRPDREKS